MPTGVSSISSGKKPTVGELCADPKSYPLRTNSNRFIVTGFHRILEHKQQVDRVVVEVNHIPRRIDEGRVLLEEARRDL